MNLIEWALSKVFPPKPGKIEPRRDLQMDTEVQSSCSKAREKKYRDGIERYFAEFAS